MKTFHKPDENGVDRSTLGHVKTVKSKRYHGNRAGDYRYKSRIGNNKHDDDDYNYDGFGYQDNGYYDPEGVGFNYGYYGKDDYRDSNGDYASSYDNSDHDNDDLDNDDHDPDNGSSDGGSSSDRC